ncbi:hypothetical protein H6B33_10470 [Gemmiger formicilis]|uniref:anti-sigma-I factor RsgI family protein n=1 Tax=Gemmiger formicilis TaxID=745368 RepID=UPI00195BDEC0|nr:hypothetical protein [Gemmiger formicilis]MBM6915825.1 hypothetical protein [Gemmiger formicilis]
MKYIVLERHPGYVVVLDEEGRFLKAADRQYQVGQQLDAILPMRPPRRRGRAILFPALTAAACLVLLALSAVRMAQMPYASVYMTINPQVRIDVNRRDTVLTVEGTNPDGEVLTEGYEGRGKALEQVMDELTDRAVEMGWLHPGGQITLTLDAEDGDWVAAHSDSLPAHLNEYLSETLQVTIRVDGGETGGQEAAIPVGPPPTAVPTAAPTAAPTAVPTPVPAGDSGYGDSAYGSSETQGDSGYTAATAPPQDSGYGEGDSGYETPAHPEQDSGYDSPEPVEDSGYGDSAYDSE